MTANKDAIAEAGKTAAITGGLGLFVSAMQNTVQKHTEGAKGVFTRTGSTVAIFAAMGGIFSLGESVAHSVRGEDDALNAGIGGCAAGMVSVLRTKSIAKMCAACAGVGATMYAYEYSGGLKGSLVGKSLQEKKEIRDSFFTQPNKVEEEA
ncbi:hypothetical protein J3Q64DRAFT_1809179 [Phycomyces blakesleeanus]|uniref:Uncharacterized protein n=2 Tax=Phycomyces blakesleeanus TaxID=4837 RepID=A0A162ZLR9_PHYB8|nr:hypothetical protein PHYBLDRAFT_136730 [Phycomyces blakesleeanus NRRL 1555(-)]OAD67671.1 hypothetical protein PHYBLDRAFT_136730 [Phycomyces blakesleeanus NRRL 1555(-)]|eukprot:XP_018285711.1 hypothetical protein PHYBLDRAFT_136730 [Phycomyces blakesleeanus NRRL 1555(-)]